MHLGSRLLDVMFGVFVSKVSFRSLLLHSQGNDFLTPYILCAVESHAAQTGLELIYGAEGGLELLTCLPSLLSVRTTNP